MLFCVVYLHDWTTKKQNMAKLLFYNNSFQPEEKKQYLKRAKTHTHTHTGYITWLWKCFFFFAQMNICTSGRCATVFDVFRCWFAYVIENSEEKTTTTATHWRINPFFSEEFTLNFAWEKMEVHTHVCAHQPIRNKQLIQLMRLLRNAKEREKEQQKWCIHTKWNQYTLFGFFNLCTAPRWLFKIQWIQQNPT